MQDWDAVVAVAAVVSALAAVATVFIMHSANQEDKERIKPTDQANDSTSRLLDIEDRRENDRQNELRQAKFDVRLKSTEKGMGVVGVKNVGIGNAYKARISIDTLPILENPNFAPFNKYVDFNGDLLSGKYVEFRYRVRMDLKTPKHFFIRWIDDMGKERVFDSDIEGC